VLDVGAAPDVERLDNCMLPWFQEAGLQLTLYSPEDVSHLQAALPGVRILAPQPGSRIPAPDASHDWVSSSAVIEHVGPLDQQEGFLRECARVAGRGVLVTCPNRWHWLEFHNCCPCPLAAADVASGRLRRVGLRSGRESHLRLLSSWSSPRDRRRARSRWGYEVSSIWTLGMPSNLVLIATRLR
jgi:hypothetical protein